MRGVQINGLLAMELIYEQRTGNLFVVDHKARRALIAVGYSGKGVGYNAPDYDDRIAEGPIPRGVWKLRPAIDHSRLGPVSVPLDPEGPKAAKGRTGFFIHGDNQRADGTASSGCIIVPRPVREFISRAGFRTLTVVSG